MPFTIAVGQTLTVNRTGTGSGTVTADSAAINGDAECSDVYPGTVVTLTAATTVTATFSDTTPPDTTILSGPSNPANNSNPTITFESSKAGSTFQCSLNGSAFVACSSPRLVSVNKGEQSFSVQAVDAAGNVDSIPAAYAWTAASIVAVVVLPIPTLSEWALILLKLTIASMGVVAYRRRM